jgi:4-hydroxybenzoate polyprenyltransferase
MAQKHWPSWRVFILVTLAMAGARTAGMTLNRIVDLSIDAKNPRTKNRPLLTGAFSMSNAWVAVAISLTVLFLSAYLLNPLCLKLSPLALIALTGYHYVKRFSALCHFVLGSVLSIAPVGGWFAVTGAFSWQPFVLALFVMSWVAGFDIIYSMQDADFDRAQGLHSIPVHAGLSKALVFSGWCHIASVLFLVLFGLVWSMGLPYAVGVGVAAVLLWLEHRLVAENDLRHIHTAFFTINGWVGVLLFVFAFLDIYR